MEIYVTILIRAVIAYLILHFALKKASKFHNDMVWGNREAEWPKNRGEPPPSDEELKWQITHLRDDIGGISAHMMHIVALLTAILAVLIIK
jgi:hypothetical protein